MNKIIFLFTLTARKGVVFYYILTNFYVLFVLGKLIYTHDNNFLFKAWKMQSLYMVYSLPSGKEMTKWSLYLHLGKMSTL